MIFRKTERYYRERKKKWIKHGNHDKELMSQVVKRTTIWFIFLPLFYWEKIVSHNL